MDEVIKAYKFVSELILQEWAVRTIGTAFMAWISVVVIRAIIYGNSNVSRKQKVRSKTQKFYVPFNFLWSIILAFRYAESNIILEKSIKIFDFFFWFLIYGLIAFGVHVIWVRGIAPFSDKKFKTNWLGEKDK